MEQFTDEQLIEVAQSDPRYVVELSGFNKNSLHLSFLVALKAAELELTRRGLQWDPSPYSREFLK